MDTMKDAKHTPGPWEVEGDSNEFGPIYHVGPAKVQCRWNNEQGIERAEADAKLIAAAPELAEAIIITAKDRAGCDYSLRHDEDQNFQDWVNENWPHFLRSYELAALQKAGILQP